jgi:serine protease Do
VSYLIANTTVGSRVPLDIIRDGRRQTIQAVVGQRPSEEELAKQAGGEEDAAPMADETPVAPGTALGLSLQTLTPQIGRAVGLPSTARGVIITAVDPSSDAADKGLRRGDLIISVNRQPVTSSQGLLAAVANARRAGRTSILLLVKRGRAPEAFIGIDIGTQ